MSGSRPDFVSSPAVQPETPGLLACSGVFKSQRGKKTSRIWGGAAAAAAAAGGEIKTSLESCLADDRGFWLQTWWASAAGETQPRREGLLSLGTRASHPGSCWFFFVPNIFAGVGLRLASPSRSRRLFERDLSSRISPSCGSARSWQPQALPGQSGILAPRGARERFFVRGRPGLRCSLWLYGIAVGWNWEASSCVRAWSAPAAGLGGRPHSSHWAKERSRGSCAFAS